MAQEHFMVAVAMNCQIFKGSVLENYMKFHGLLSHFTDSSLGVQLEISQIS